MSKQMVIHFVSKEGEVFEVSERVEKLSQFACNDMEEDEEELRVQVSYASSLIQEHEGEKAQEENQSVQNVFSLNIKSEVLSAVIEFMNHYVVEEMAKVPKVSDHL